LPTIYLQMCNQPEIDRDKAKSVLLDTNVTSYNPSAYLGSGHLSSPMSKINQKNPETQSFVLKTFDMAETTKHKDVIRNDVTTTEKKFLSSFGKGYQNLSSHKETERIHSQLE